MKFKHAESVLDEEAVPQILILPSAFEEKVICEFRCAAKLSWDDIYLSLKDQIKPLPRF